MFGCGLTRFQPAYVEDVAEAVTRRCNERKNIPYTQWHQVLRALPGKSIIEEAPEHP